MQVFSPVLLCTAFVKVNTAAVINVKKKTILDAFSKFATKNSLKTYFCNSFCSYFIYNFYLLWFLSKNNLI